jgi:hypothetical protein
MEASWGSGPVEGPAAPQDETWGEEPWPDEPAPDDVPVRSVADDADPWQPGEPDEPAESIEEPLGEPVTSGDRRSPPGATFDAPRSGDPERVEEVGALEDSGP